MQGPLCGGCGHVASSFTIARCSPKSCATAGPVACRGGVLSVVGRCLYAQHRSHTVTGYAESGRGDKTPRSTRAPRAAFTLQLAFTQECRYSQTECTMGKGQCNVHTPRRLLYTIMMSAAVLARGRIGTC